MRKFASALLFIILFAAIGLIAFLLIWHREKETLATVTGLLAVIAAVISAWPALRVLALQDDSSRPRPTPYFDLSSRYNLLQLRVKNIGPSVAYDVRLEWKTRPQNYKGEEITVLDEIPVLLPDQSVSTLMGTSLEVVNRYSSMRFEGVAHLRDANGKSLHQKFICSTQEHQKRLMYDEELPKTLRDLQDVPEQLKQIVAALKKTRGDS